MDIIPKMFSTISYENTKKTAFVISSLHVNPKK